MQEPTHEHLEDALRAATLIGAFTTDASFEDFVADDLLKSAVERQFQIIGQVLDALSQQDAATATAIADLDDYVALGRALTLHHDGTDDQHLWNVVENALPRLVLVLWHLLEPR
jgi:uncharacterized protein with HEPN domain